MINRDRSRGLGGAIAGLLLMAGCAAPPRGTVPVEVPGDGEPRVQGSLPTASPAPLVVTARSYLGTPYRYGGTDRNGMDCSGFVYRVFSHYRVRLPRTSAKQFRVGRQVPPGSLRSGDLVFFSNSRGHVDHVGIYVDDGRFIHASTGHRRVREDSLWSGYFRDHFVGARRIDLAER